MTFSIITPLHAPGNDFITDTYRSLDAQTFGGWEWIILENHGGVVPGWIRFDPRVRVVRAEIDGVGALKATLCQLAQRPWVVELDADDLLAPYSLERIAKAFDAGADFVYSDFAEFKNGSWEPSTYNARYGWKSYKVEYDGHPLIAMQAPEATAHNIRLVDWAPNHVRAWTAESYRRVGGHDPRREVADDHDLVVRFFLAGCKMVRIPECLYFYRVHDQNTVNSRNTAIRLGTADVYNANIWKLAEKWSADRGLLNVDLCGGIDARPGYLTLDRTVSDISCDLEQPWPVKNASVGVLRAHDAIEHLADPIHTMNEAWRVLAPGGWLMIHVPSTNGLGAFCDPTHRSFWNKLSFRYYTDPAFSRYLHGLRARFQVSRVLEWYPSDWHRAENVPYVEAHLFAVKEGFRAMGECLWPFT